jgi:CO/xanthine dehydrogenase Mo-binding subunit
MVYAVPVCSTVAKGRITRLDTSEAEKMVGVVAILHREKSANCTGLRPTRHLVPILTKNARL